MDTLPTPSDILQLHNSQSEEVLLRSVLGLIVHFEENLVTVGSEIAAIVLSFLNTKSSQTHKSNASSQYGFALILFVVTCLLGGSSISTTTKGSWTAEK